VDDPRLGQLAGAAVENVFTLGLGQVAAGSPFVPAYSAAAGSAPSWRAALAYDAAALIVASVERAAHDGRPTRASVRAALAQTKGYAGVAGRVSFGGNGENTEAAVSVYALTGKVYPGAVVP
jgi:branched-chain amino acid transport system substrate-binding protein